MHAKLIFIPIRGNGSYAPAAERLITVQTDQLKRGAILMIVSGLLFSMMGGIVKYISAHLPN